MGFFNFSGHNRDADESDSGSASSNGPSNGGGPVLKLKVSYGSSTHDVHAPSLSNFGHLKRVLAQETGLKPEDQKLFFRGEEKHDDEILLTAGVKNLSKLLLMEDQSSKAKKFEDMKVNEEVSRACNAIDRVRAEVDKLSEKVAKLEGIVSSGIEVVEKEFALLTELLMRELLKLDGIEAVGEAKLQRKMEVRRIQSLVETLDALKQKS